ncbi:polypeptide N-acetylgalactosaminyltransferase 13-like, partial [Tropilaelaps mercedesae]
SAVILDQHEVQLAEYEASPYVSYNLYIANRIPLDRSLPDFRSSRCRRVVYKHPLPTASVVVVFRNEALSVLMRTVMSVIMRTVPPQMLKEILLVDDHSETEELGFPLEWFVDEFYPRGLVRLLRMPVESGIVAGRLAGARAAGGDALVFLDSHCEVTKGWLPPLIAPIMENRKSIVYPIMPHIDRFNMSVTVPPAEGAQSPYGRDLRIGGFAWGDSFEWFYRRAQNDDGTFLSEMPISPGGLYAIDRRYFWESGSYDEEMKLWGAENLEQSFRIWQCGGRILRARCSFVGHIFHSAVDESRDMNVLERNTRRAIDVWMDEYRDLFLAYAPPSL